MADNVAITAGSGTPIATDDAGAGGHVQIIKLAISTDGSATVIPADAANGLDVDVTRVQGVVTVNDPDGTTSGTISATDAVVAAPAGDGTLRSGASTANSYVSIACPGGDSAWNVQVTGLTSGTLYWEESLDSTNGVDGNWINVNGRQTGVVNTVLGGNATANGVYRGNTSGAKYFRVRSVGALTGTPAIQIRVSAGTGAIFLNASIPAGTNNIGGLTSAKSATGTTANITAATSDTVLDAANANRLGLMLYNDSTASCYVKFGTGASATSFTFFMGPGAYWEMPSTIYTGTVNGLWTTAAGTMRVTELT